MLVVGVFGGYDPNNEKAAPLYCRLPAHQVLCPWPDMLNTFIGYHGEVPRPDRPSERPLAGLLLGKNPRVFNGKSGWQSKQLATG